MPDSQQYELPRFDLMVARVRGGGGGSPTTHPFQLGLDARSLTFHDSKIS